jgi:hypothetical protein
MVLNPILVYHHHHTKKILLNGLITTKSKLFIIFYQKEFLFFSSRVLSSRPHSTLESPFFRSTPIDPLQEWYPQPSLHSNNNHLTNRSQSVDHTTNGLLSSYPSHNYQPQSSNSYSLDSNLNTSHYQQPAIPSYRSTSSITSNLIDHQQDIQATISKDSIEKQNYDQTSSTNESLTRYVKMLLERSPNQDNNSSYSKCHNLSFFLLIVISF